MKSAPSLTRDDELALLTLAARRADEIDAAEQGSSYKLRHAAGNTVRARLLIEPHVRGTALHELAEMGFYDGLMSRLGGSV